jgi:PIN domain nuclease of toxin-antitoxin system
MLSMYALDTHPLVFYAADQMGKLGKAARQVFEAFEAGRVSLFVPAPVLLEVWMLVKGGRIQMETSLDAWWKRISAPQLFSVDLSGEDVLRAASLRWHHGDLFDRLIVAIALRLDCPLLTRDAAITDWGGVDVVW